MLSGDIADFSLRNVLEFLSAGDKSGLLTIRSGSIDGGVFLRDGEVCLALVDVTRVPLGPRLVALDLVDRETVRDAGAAVDGTTFGLACGLMRVASDADEARNVAGGHTRESIGWLSQHDHASFVFDCTVTVDAWPFDPLPCDELLADAEHSATQWAEMRDVIDDLSCVPSCLVESSSMTEVRLTSAQWRVVALADGRRSINDILELIGLTQLETCRELAGLIAAGLVELVRAGGNSAVDMLLHDVRAVDALAFGRAVPANDEPSPTTRSLSLSATDPGSGLAITDAGVGTPSTTIPHAGAHPVHKRNAAPDGAGDAPSATPAGMPSDVNVGLFNRLIDGGRRK